MSQVSDDRTFDVGGVRLKQPFKIRRLGHIGLHVKNLADCLTFYHDHLGFRVADTIDFSARAEDPEAMRRLGDTKMYFMRHGTDHHSFVLIDRKIGDLLLSREDVEDDMTVNQLSWQVGTLGEVGRAIEWFKELGIHTNRVGRDMPGSNWMIYPFDQEGHRCELFYGMEQIGWDGRSKPREMHERGFMTPPALPQIPEFEEVRNATEADVDLVSGHADLDRLTAEYDVDGILLPRPFRVVRHGPVRLFVRDPAQVRTYYEDIMGFTLTEEVTWKGQSCLFFRCNTEHHVLAFYPIALREELGLDPESSVMSVGFQMGSYEQLKDAVRFMLDKGHEMVDVPLDLNPGIDQSVYFRDPSGHLAQLYFSIEQIGWDGKSRPASARRPLAYKDWPDVLDGNAAPYLGEPFFGPLG